MHSVEGSKGTKFHINGDFSGAVLMNIEEHFIGDAITSTFGTFRQVSVPFEDLKDLVAAYVRSELITSIETAPTDYVLLGIRIDDGHGD